MKELIIGKNDAGQRLDRFLVKAFPKLSQGAIQRALREKRVKLDGKRPEAGARLTEGAQLRLYLSDEWLLGRTTARQTAGALAIVYEDENILLADKPVGLVVHEDKDNTGDTLIGRIQAYLVEKGEYDPAREASFSPALCNRIDRNTGGIVIAAKTAAALRIITEKLREREIVKKYLCVVVGELSPKSGTLTAFLEKLADENRVIVTPEKTAKNLTIKTRYRVLESCRAMSLVEVELLTGRTHQIRAHMAYIGHPLLGDGKYGANRLNQAHGYKTQALYSYFLRFDFAGGAGELAYLAGREFWSGEPWFVEKYHRDKLKFE